MHDLFVFTRAETLGGGGVSSVKVGERRGKEFDSNNRWFFNRFKIWKNKCIWWLPVHSVHHTWESDNCHHISRVSNQSIVVTSGGLTNLQPQEVGHQFYLRNWNCVTYPLLVWIMYRYLPYLSRLQYLYRWRFVLVLSAALCTPPHLRRHRPLPAGSTGTASTGTASFKTWSRVN